MKFYPWWWLPSWKRIAQLEAKLQTLIDNQDMLTDKLLDSVNRMTAVAESQSAIVQRWISMFDQSSERETKRWTRDVKQENAEFLEDKGFPFDASESEQAEWVKKDLGLI